MVWLDSAADRRSERFRNLAVVAKSIRVISAVVLFLIVAVAFSSAWITEKQWAAGYDSEDPFWISQADGPRHGISEHYHGGDPWGFAMTYWARFQWQTLWIFAIVLVVLVLSWVASRRLTRAAHGLSTSVLTPASGPS
jgi:hypothetical protein